LVRRRRGWARRDTRCRSVSSNLGDLTVAHLRNRAHGTVSNAPVEERLWFVGEWREGKAIWWQSFRTETEALEAAGLRE
jgi:hypothetical protein